MASNGMLAAFTSYVKSFGTTRPELTAMKSKRQSIGQWQLKRQQTKHIQEFHAIRDDRSKPTLEQAVELLDHHIQGRNTQIWITSRGLTLDITPQDVHNLEMHIVLYHSPERDSDYIVEWTDQLITEAISSFLDGVMMRSRPSLTFPRELRETVKVLVGHLIEDAPQRVGQKGANKRRSPEQADIDMGCKSLSSTPGTTSEASGKREREDSALADLEPPPKKVKVNRKTKAATTTTSQEELEVKEVRGKGDPVFARLVGMAFGFPEITFTAEKNSMKLSRYIIKPSDERDMPYCMGEMACHQKIAAIKEARKKNIARVIASARRMLCLNHAAFRNQAPQEALSIALEQSTSSIPASTEDLVSTLEPLSWGHPISSRFYEDPEGFRSRRTWLIGSANDRSSPAVRRKMHGLGVHVSTQDMGAQAGDDDELELGSVGEAGGRHGG